MLWDDRENIYMPASADRAIVRPYAAPAPLEPASPGVGAFAVAPPGYEMPPMPERAPADPLRVRITPTHPAPAPAVGGFTPNKKVGEKLTELGAEWTKADRERQQALAQASQKANDDAFDRAFWAWLMSQNGGEWGGFT